MAKISKATSTTGNTLVPPDLGDLDRKVLSVIGESSSTGIGGVPDLGFTTVSLDFSQANVQNR